MNNIRFENRIEAAEKLSNLLSKYKDGDAVVLGIPRGGAVTGKEIAKKLALPLGLVFVRKIGHPYNPEYAVAAVSESGLIEKDVEEIKNIDKKWFEEEVNNQLMVIKKRKSKYLGESKQTELKDKIVIIVDDGLATGLTMMAAISEVKHHHPKKIVVAVPVSPLDTSVKIKNAVDEFVSLYTPEFFEGAVGVYYRNFPQVEDEEVINMLKNTNDPVLFYMPDFVNQANEILKLPNYSKGDFEIVNFSNQEFQVRVNSNVKNMETVYLGTLSPPYLQTMESLFTCHTIKKEGAKEIIGIFPYLSFMRHDKNKPNEDQATELVAKILKDSGISEVITFDIHSDNDLSFFEIPIVSLSTAELLANKIKQYGFKASSVVAPDKGARNRAELFRSVFDDNCSLVTFNKNRQIDKKLESAYSEGEIGDRAIVVDDILDTGQTLLNCVRILREKGVKEIIIAVTHGLFTGDKWKNLFDYGVKKICVTDTIPSVVRVSSDLIEVVSISPLILKQLQSKSF